MNPSKSPEQSLPRKEPENPTGEYMVIDTGFRRRWLGMLGYGVLFLAVSLLLMWLFAKFTESWALAGVLVGFMVTYMAVMGWLASRRMDHEDDGNLR